MNQKTAVAPEALQEVKEQSMAVGDNFDTSSTFHFLLIENHTFL